MGQERQNTTANYSERSKSQKAIDCLLKVGAFFIILEPIWMLLPFAGFLYGSVMHIEILSQNPYTSWLVHFVFPIHTLFPLQKHPPVIEGELELSGDSPRKVELVMVKGPVLQAAPFERVHRQFWDNAYEMLISSAKIKQALNQIGLRENHTLLAFLTPGSNWRSAAHHDYRTAKVNAFMVVAEAPMHSIHGGIFKHNFNIKTLKLVRAQELSYGRLENGQDPTEGEVIVSGPPIGIVNASFQKRIQDRINFFVSGML